MPIGTIVLPCFGIVLELHCDGAGAIVASDLKEECGHAKRDHCDGTCVESYNAGMEAIESLILAHACAGIDVTSPAYVEGIETAVGACADNL